ncbi:putative lipoprotein [Myxococcus stipitatus DSM 14675]|uniref:Putative lipoprotein n=1 Tax=Myxococcus stipitatus (strain DSM 14675 / JCM 12634 / Mx s8) TaxID=1278073 RepID=L7U989_MYXSD|nr:hypothetical protein [Myxococcus stipitatus]AGC43014.1 putative lipoprotein [Myxococcus stipitatus DSM 14675]
MRPVLALSLVLLVAACGEGDVPPDELVETSKARVERAVAAGHLARGALEMLGVMPVYTCGEPRRTFLDVAMVDVRTRVSCVTTSIKSMDAVTDAVLFTFAESGCEIHGLKFTGRAVIQYRGGEDRMEVEASLHELEVDGQPLNVAAGYGTCGDQTSAWAQVYTAVPGQPDHGIQLDVRVTKRPGLPLLGGTTLILDGQGALVIPDGRVDRLAFTTLQYEVGEFLPKEGTLTLQTVDGHFVEASFQPGLWRLGKVKLTVDDHKSVTVPIVR